MFIALTLDLAPQNLALALLAISTVGAFAYGYLQKRGRTREAALAKAAFVGVKTAFSDLVGKPITLPGVVAATEDAIYAAAADLNVPEAHVDQHVGEGLAALPRSA